MKHLFTFITAIYFCCLVILFLTNKIVKSRNTHKFSRFDFDWQKLTNSKWYLYLEDKLMIPINLLLIIFFLLLALAMKEWI